MSVCAYGGKKIIPAPFVSISKEYQDIGGYKVGSVYTINIIGKILAFKGSPNSSGAFHTGSGYPADETITEDARLAAMERKIEALKELFSTDGLVLEWQSDNGASPLKCNPRIKSVSIQDGSWYNTCDFTITCEADDLVGLASPGAESFLVDGDAAAYIQAFSESWGIEQVLEADATYYVVTHTMSATGKRHYEPGGGVDKEAWERARDLISVKKGMDGDILSASLIEDLSSYGQYVQSNSENIDEIAGTYSYTEIYSLSNQNYTETFTVQTSAGSGNISVTVSGEIRGFGGTVDERIAAASAAIGEDILFNRAQTYSGYSLNANYLNKNVTKSPTSGTISYSYEYNDRASYLIPGALSEDYQVSFEDPSDIFAEIVVLGRVAGPVLQNLNTVSARIKSLNISAVMPRNTVYSNPPDVTSIVNNFKPGVCFTNKPTATWNPITGSFSYSVSWTY